MEATPPEKQEQTAAWSSLTVFLVLHPDGEPQKILDFLRAHPDMRITLIFPPKYFDDPGRRPLAPQFSVLQSSANIEIGLSLDNQPILPLLADLNLAGDKAQKWGFSYTWPEDVAAQIARGSGRYQKRWGTLPAGFYPPHLALSEQVVQTLKRFRLNWTIGKPREEWGVQFYGGTALLVPPAPPIIDELTLGSKEWANQMVEWTRDYPFVLVDTTQLEDPHAEQYFLEFLAKRKASRLIVTGQELVTALRNEFSLPDGAEPFDNDYSGWVATSQQKRAWTALADARKVVDTYQSSGRADLKRLDAAVEEMCNAQGGEFLLNLGANAGSGTVDIAAGERNFLATLANVYRLCGVAVPPNLNTWFATRTWQKAVSKTALNDGPFFTEGAQSLIWNDPKADDLGAGQLVYPVGNHPKGMFDLREFTISWDENDVTLTANVLEAFTGKSPALVPMLDIYIDVNRLPDAGNTSALRKRGNTSISREAAWEYAVALSAKAAALYQAVPGDSPRLLGVKAVNPKGRTFSVSFPRSQLRGKPKSWRISAGLLSTENTRRQQEEPVPAPILVTATEKNLGGAPSSHVTPYIDLLDESEEDQTGRFQTGNQTGQLALPFVEAQ